MTALNTQYGRDYEANPIEGQYYLGNCYYYGSGLTEDKVEGVRWFRLAAEAGHAMGQYWLGSFSYDGKGGLSKDHAAAKMWWTKAAAQGITAAKDKLAEKF